MIVTLLSVVLILAGLVFFLGAAVGLVRFPAFYTRMHAAGKGDTLSSLLVVLGLAVWRLHDVHGLAGLREHWSILLVILKLLAICAFIMITSPTATHALMDAGFEDGIDPVIDGENNNALHGRRAQAPPADS